MYYANDHFVSFGSLRLCERAYSSCTSDENTGSPRTLIAFPVRLDYQYNGRGPFDGDSAPGKRRVRDTFVTASKVRSAFGD